MLDVALKHHFPSLALDINFRAPTGVTVLFGPSGSGKTSVLRAVAGLFDPDQSRISLDGTVLDGTPPQSRELGYVFQDARLFPHLSVARNLDFAARFRGGTEAKTRTTVIDTLDLAPLLDRMPAGLSGGERQRVAIGRALLAKPRLLCMDEPLASLDTALKAQILPYLERLRDISDIPILYVSHDAGEVARLATTLVVLRQGRVVQSGPVDQVLSDPAALPDLGVRAAGAVLSGEIADHVGDLTRLALSAGTLLLPRINAPLGTRIRLRIAAQDIILATTKPRDISALNVLPATIDKTHAGAGPGVAVRLSSGTDCLLARITKSSAARLNLEPGSQVFAILKATAFDPIGVGS